MRSKPSKKNSQNFFPLCFSACPTPPLSPKLFFQKQFPWNSIPKKHSIFFISHLPISFSIPNHGFQLQIPKETQCFTLPLQSLHHPFLRRSLHRSHSVSSPHFHHLCLLSLCLHSPPELMVRRSSRCSICLESPSFC